jgi:hypothetical protein
MEWTMINQGFDYAYDKRLYDRLKEAHAEPVKSHLIAPVDYQSRMARFLENHDEQRVAADFSQGMHEAAAVVTYFSPGLRFFHQGQFEGRLKRISPHLVRGPEEKVNLKIETFYRKLLDILQKPVFRSGEWQILNCREAWGGNASNSNYISFLWQGTGDEKILVVVNYASYPSQCYINLPFSGIAGKSLSFHDLMSEVHFQRDGGDLQEKGLYMDESSWKYYIFSVTLQ